jgi:hypothetical protein
LGVSKGYGCDGIDNDKNGEVDECGEDTFGPLIDTSAAFALSRNTWSTNTGGVLDFISGTTATEDDCGLAPLTNAKLLSACDASTVTLVVLDRCENQAVAEVPVFFDARPPEVDIEVENDLFEGKCFWFRTNKDTHFPPTFT